ncbi:DNA gyrase subunit A [Halonatronum saccharophilum]|uniref:DNA gyrase subunit A n=1 Tax=Halonatronum saccharophilum TaxID=150060 RepID=UPI00047F17CA|nr:DNA gyrase subunit A [Halonatronum saccharophilum]
MLELENDRIKPVDIEDEMQEAYIDYAMSVIVSRAIPDVRDGLKPVHRRILYAMNDIGLRPPKSHKKSARIVGEVLGKYHPHGDTAVYDTMVRMAQDFSYRYPLVDGHGNFGSVDGDSAAAMRYTEARMDKITIELLSDINKETVDFVDNFDGSLKEPKVLPARIPNLLVNGTSGIAVGMSTNIPPHNLGEVVDGVIEIIENPDIETNQLMKIIKGPDFPTGGIIMGRKAIKQYFETGRGKIKVRAKTEIEEMKNDKSRIIITELPYQVNKAKLVEKIADLVRDNKVEGITDLRDESDRRGMRVVIELKRGINPNIVLNRLYKYTRLKVTFGTIMLSLVDGEPKVLGVKDVLKYYLEHQKDVITRRTQYDLNKAQNRAHILEGFKIALDNIDRVIKIIRAADDSSSAQESLMSEFGFSEKQAKAILDMRLNRLTNLERNKIDDEYDGLQKDISYFKSILNSEEKLLNIIKEELLELKDKYNDDRRTEITDEIIDLEVEDLIPEEDIVITLTKGGYIKRILLDTYKNQHRGGKGIIGIKTKEGDMVQDIYTTSTHNHILFFTDKGRMYRLKGYQIPEGGRQARGTAIINLLDIENDENITTVIPIADFEDDKYLLMATKSGIVKKSSLEEYNTNYTGLIALTLDDDDELIDVKITDGNQDIILGTQNGLAIRFPEDDVRSIGRSARGVKGIDLQEEDKVIGLDTIEEEKEVLVITDKGYGKRTPTIKYRTQTRGGKGLITLNRTENNGNLIDIKVIDDSNEIMIITWEGILLRTSISEISLTGRNTQGVKVISLNKGDKVASIGYIDKD